MNISPHGISLIKRREGLRTRAYRCQAGVLTIGYGHTGHDVYAGQVITQLEALIMLTADLKRTQACIEKYVRVPLTQGQFDALMSWVYNLGCGSLARSTLLKELNAEDYNGAANQLLRWTKVDGKELAGLVARRNEERDLFLGGIA